MTTLPDPSRGIREKYAGEQEVLDPSDNSESNLPGWRRV
jgi:hypothetical protein